MGYDFQMNTLTLLRRIIYWILPQGVFNFLSVYFHHRTFEDFKNNPLLLANKKLHDVHKGQRCFILATGPSISKQNLLPLKNEICMSLNMFYLHKDYKIINPHYHLISGIAPHPKITNKLAKLWFGEIDKKVNSEYLLLNYLDKPFVDKNKLFFSKNVFYFDFSTPLEMIQKNGIDATNALYMSQTASMMAIQLAIYMGFHEIYLLGVDHDGILRYTKRLPMHFYKPAESIFEVRGIHDGDNFDWEIEFHNQWMLWRQYKLIKQYADLKGSKIINITPESLLDVFERRDYESVLKYER